MAPWAGVTSQYANFPVQSLQHRAAQVEELERAHRQGVAALQGQLDAALPLAEECACLRAKVLSLEGAVTELASTAEVRNNRFYSIATTALVVEHGLVVS